MGHSSSLAREHSRSDLVCDVSGKDPRGDVHGVEDREEVVPGVRRDRAEVSVDLDVEVRDEEGVEEPIARGDAFEYGRMNVPLATESTYRKAPIVASVYRGSRNPPKSMAVRRERLPESGSRVRIVRHETVRHARRMKAMMRTAHPKPTLGMSCSSRTGKTTPPLALPPVLSPMTSARRFRNQWLRTAIEGLKLGGRKREILTYSHM